MQGRFDYVQYDELAAAAQKAIKEKCTDLEVLMDALPNGRGKALALTKLEEAYMWAGKAIRDDQIVRNGSAPLQEHRNNS